MTTRNLMEKLMPELLARYEAEPDSRRSFWATNEQGEDAWDVASDLTYEFLMTQELAPDVRADLENWMTEELREHIQPVFTPAEMQRVEQQAQKLAEIALRYAREVYDITPSGDDENVRADLNVARAFYGLQPINENDVDF